MEPKVYARKYSEKAKSKTIKMVMHLYKDTRRMFYEIEEKLELLNEPAMDKLQSFLEGAIVNDEGYLGYDFWAGIKAAYSKDDVTDDAAIHECANLDYIVVKSLFDVYRHTSNNELLSIAKAG